MKILFWVPPWIENSDPNYFRNSTKKHLVPQANSLANLNEDIQISFALPEYLGSEAASIDPKVEIIDLPLTLTLNNDTGIQKSEIYRSLYADNSSEFVISVIAHLEALLGDSYDCILCWENPVPFLEKMYPSALIVHQMPGFFSRPPYPHTVTFDPVGLYKSSIFNLYAQDIQSGAGITNSAKSFARAFSLEARRSIFLSQPFNDSVLPKDGEHQTSELLPLQISDHYAFREDSKVENQFYLALKVLNTTSSDNRIITTQYVTSLAREKPFDTDISNIIYNKYPNFYYNENFDKIDNVSQFLLPYVDGVVCASSSLGIQGMLWQKNLRIVGSTFLKHYDSSEKTSSSVSWSDRCENTIATILARYQPLAHSVTKDGSFLYKLIKDMIARKASGKSGLDLLPRFDQIEPTYNQLVMNNFRVNEVLKNLPKKNANLDKEIAVCKNFNDLISDPVTKAISFDVFDTLIRRNVEKPADIFKFLDLEALGITKGVAENFGRIRIQCEVETRKKHSSTKSEITLDDIYETIYEYYGLDEEQVNALKHAEIQLELDSTSAKPFGRKLYNMALLSGLPIYLISDMYLPKEVVQEMLHKAQYDDYSDLYLSSDCQCRKYDGKLYKLFLKNTGLSPDNLVHVGDNKQTDIIQAQMLGIRAMRWSSAIEWMRSNKIYRKIYNPRDGSGEKARSAIAGNTALLFDRPVSKKSMESLSGGEPHRLGYSVLGPLLVGYMSWLLREVQRDGISDLYFLSREGWILKQSFDALFNTDDTLPRTNYLYGSRRAIVVASMRSRGDIQALVNAPYEPGARLGYLLKSRFGIELSAERSSHLSSLSNISMQYSLSRSFEDQSLWQSICNELVDDILEKASAERVIYEKYLKTIGFYKSKNPAIVDIGWKANMQGALGNLTGRRLTGYYYATIQGIDKWHMKGDKHRCYAGLGISQGALNSALVRNRHLAEFLFCHEERSIMAMSEKGAEIKPIFMPEVSHAQRRVFISALHTGALEFVNNYKNGFGKLNDQIFIDPSFAELAFREFSESPSYEDAMLLHGLIFQDEIGGINKKYIISPLADNYFDSSAWKKGAEIIHKKVSSPNPSEIIENNTPRRSKEKTILRFFLSERMFRKYLRNRDIFFQDSKSKLFKKYYDMTR